jgi:hypothetical protein
MIATLVVLALLGRRARRPTRNFAAPPAPPG